MQVSHTSACACGLAGPCASAALQRDDSAGPIPENSRAFGDAQQAGDCGPRGGARTIFHAFCARPSKSRNEKIENKKRGALRWGFWGGEKASVFRVTFIAHGPTWACPVPTHKVRTALCSRSKNRKWLVARVLGSCCTAHIHVQCCYMYIIADRRHRPQPHSFAMVPAVWTSFSTARHSVASLNAVVVIHTFSRSTVNTRPCPARSTELTPRGTCAAEELEGRTAEEPHLAKSIVDRATPGERDESPARREAASAGVDQRASQRLISQRPRVELSCPRVRRVVRTAPTGPVCAKAREQQN